MASDLESRYPGGRWVTMRGRHVYVKADGSLAPETAPKLPAAWKADNYAKDVEMVPISFLRQIREWNHTRENARNSPEEWDALKNDISVHGIRAPLIINYDPKTGHALLGEGNHRLAILEELGQTHAPARVGRSRSIGDNPRARKLSGAVLVTDAYVKAEMKPSDVFVDYDHIISSDPERRDGDMPAEIEPDDLADEQISTIRRTGTVDTDTVDDLLDALFGKSLEPQAVHDTDEPDAPHVAGRHEQVIGATEAIGNWEWADIRGTEVFLKADGEFKITDESVCELIRSKRWGLQILDVSSDRFRHLGWYVERGADLGKKGETYRLFIWPKRTPDMEIEETVANAEFAKDSIWYDSRIANVRIDGIRLKPHNGYTPHVPSASGLIWRGVCYEEMQAIRDNGHIQTTGEYNFDSQGSLTYFAERLDVAAEYAGKAAPYQRMPTFERYSYVIGIRRPDPSKIDEENSPPGEVAVRGHIDSSEIVAVYEVRPFAIWQGHVDLVRTFDGMTGGFVYRQGERKSPNMLLAYRKMTKEEVGSLSTRIEKSITDEMARKYPGGHWVTMRGHRVYIKADGQMAPETDPTKGSAASKGSKKSPAKADEPAKQSTKAKKTAEKPTETTSQPAKGAKKPPAKAKAEEPAKPAKKDAPKGGLRIGVKIATHPHPDNPRAANKAYLAVSLEGYDDNDSAHRAIRNHLKKVATRKEANDYLLPDGVDSLTALKGLYGKYGPMMEFEDTVKNALVAADPKLFGNLKPAEKAPPKGSKKPPAKAVEEPKKPAKETKAAKTETKPAKPEPAAKKPTKSRLERLAERRGETADTVGTEKPKIDERGRRKKAEYQDVGQKVGGARKDVSARFMDSRSVDDLKALEQDDATKAYEAVKRDNLWEKFDAQKEMDNGVSPGAAFLKKGIIAAIAKSPQKLKYSRSGYKGEDDNSPQARENYLRATNLLQDLFSKAKTAQNVVDGITDIIRRANNSVSVPEIKPEDFPNFDAFNKARAEAYREANKDRYALIESLHSLGATFFNRYMRAGDTWREHRGTARGYDEKGDWSWSEAKARAATTGETKTAKPKWERQVPTEVVRKGGAKKPPATKAADFMKVFGMRGVEFGNWVNDDEAKYHVEQASLAFADFSDITGIPMKDLSLNGRLAMAFGARGKGHAAAHYEREKKVINMTKFNGGGSLAHEWSHALDNILSDTSFPASTGATDGMVTEGKIGPLADPKVKAAFEEVKKAIRQGDGKYTVDVTDGMKSEKRYSVNSYLARNGWDIDLALAEVRRTYPSTKPKMLEDIGKQFVEHMRQNGHKPPKSFSVPTGMSQYVTTSMGMGEYYGRSVELFARAFESFVEDKLVEDGRYSSYLVAGTALGEGATTGLFGEPWPYPLGSERKAINAAMQKLVDAVRETNALKKSLDILELREHREIFRHVITVPEPTVERFFHVVDVENPDLVKGLKASDLTGGRWVTIEGTHVYIKGGKVVAGPKALKDLSLKDAKAKAAGGATKAAKTPAKVKTGTGAAKTASGRGKKAPEADGKPVKGIKKPPAKAENLPKSLNPGHADAFRAFMAKHEPGKAPWEMSKEEFQKSPPKGFKYVPNLKAWANATHDDRVEVGPKWFDEVGGSSKLRKRILAHELGHNLADRMNEDGTSFKLANSGAMGKLDKHKQLIDGFEGTYNPQEFVAESMAALMTDKEGTAKLKEKYPEAYAYIATRAVQDGWPVLPSVKKEFAGKPLPELKEPEKPKSKYPETEEGQQAQMLADVVEMLDDELENWPEDRDPDKRASKVKMRDKYKAKLDEMEQKLKAAKKPPAKAEKKPAAKAKDEPKINFEPGQRVKTPNGLGSVNRVEGGKVHVDHYVNGKVEKTVPYSPGDIAVHDHAKMLAETTLKQQEAKAADGTVINAGDYVQIEGVKGPAKVDRVSSLRGDRVTVTLPNGKVDEFHTARVMSKAEPPKPKAERKPAAPKKPKDSPIPSDWKSEHEGGFLVVKRDGKGNVEKVRDIPAKDLFMFGGSVKSAIRRLQDEKKAVRLVDHTGKVIGGSPSWPIEAESDPSAQGKGGDGPPKNLDPRISEKYPEVVKALGDSLTVSDFDDPVVLEHVHHLSVVPPSVLKNAAAKGVKVTIGATSVAGLDGNDDLKGVTPRGWPPDKTWDDASGVYRTLTKSVMAGKGDHGSASLVLHELGHALGDVFGLDDHPALIEHHKRLYDKLSPYLQQGGPGGIAGRQELLAEGFASLMARRSMATARDYDAEFVQFLQEEVVKRASEAAQ